MDFVKIQPQNIQKITNVLKKFKEEINQRYNFICLQSIYYNPPNLVLYDIKKSVKELWEENEKIDHSFIECVIIQLRIMEKMGLTFYAISMEDIYLLHYEKPIYVIISNDIVELNENRFTLSFPSFSRDKDEYLLYPEMLRLRKIPVTFHKSVIYYSVGLIVFSFLFGCPLWKEEYYMDDIPIVDYLEKIKGTKMYFFLKRCFGSELLFI